MKSNCLLKFYLCKIKFISTHQIVWDIFDIIFGGNKTREVVTILDYIVKMPEFYLCKIKFISTHQIVWDIFDIIFGGNKTREVVTILDYIVKMPEFAKQLLYMNTCLATFLNGSQVKLRTMLKCACFFSLFPPDSHNGFVTAQIVTGLLFHVYGWSHKTMNTVCDNFVSSTNTV